MSQSVLEIGEQSPSQPNSPRRVLRAALAFVAAVELTGAAVAVRWIQSERDSSSCGAHYLGDGIYRIVECASPTLPTPPAAR